MCGRYYIAEEDASEELLRIIEAVNRKSGGDEKAVRTAGEIFPTDRAPVLACNRAKQPSVFAMEWGYTLPDGRRVINARSETVHEKGMFRDGLRNRRCLIPASGYYEWLDQEGKKIRYGIRAKESSMICMAGIYRMEGDKPVFTILTRDAAPEVAFIHSRMPVILSGEAKERWLELNDDAMTVLRAAVAQNGYTAAQA